MHSALQTFTNRIIVTGHYGSGKTNLAVNLALDLKKLGRSVVLADLDIVNPYFRSADFRGLAEAAGVELIAPNYANSNLDIPSLTGELDGRLGGEATVIVDVGGDDAGAYALGRYAPRLVHGPYDMLYVVNAYRYLTREPGEAVELLREIEAASRLRATGLVNNSNLSWQTKEGDVAQSVDYARQAAEQAGLPLLFTAVSRDLYGCMGGQAGELYPVDIHVKAPWS